MVYFWHFLMDCINNNSPKSRKVFIVYINENVKCQWIIEQGNASNIVGTILLNHTVVLLYVHDLISLLFLSTLLVFPCFVGGAFLSFSSLWVSFMSNVIFWWDAYQKCFGRRLPLIWRVLCLIYNLDIVKLCIVICL